MQQLQKLSCLYPSFYKTTAIKSQPISHKKNTSDREKRNDTSTDFTVDIKEAEVGKHLRLYSSENQTLRRKFITTVAKVCIAPCLLCSPENI